jgi:hypothetical protein
LALSSWSTGGRTTSPLGSIPSCSTNNTSYGQPCDKRVGNWDEIRDSGHLPLLPNDPIRDLLVLALIV